MASSLQVTTGPYDLTFTGHDSIEQFDTEAGIIGAALELADRSTIYRSTLAAGSPFWEAAVALHENVTGIKRLVDEERTAAAKQRSKTPDNVEPVLETEPQYAKRVFALATDEQKGLLQAGMQEIASRPGTVSAAPTVRRSGPTLASRNKASEILTRPESARTAAINRVLSVIGDFDFALDEAGLPTADSLAVALIRYDKIVSAI